MVDGSLEEDCWGGIGVVGREGEGELEGKTGIWCVVGTFDCRSPGEKVAVSRRKGRDTGRGRGHELHQLGLQSITQSVTSFEGSNAAA